MSVWADYQNAYPPCSSAPQPGTAALAAALETVWPIEHSMGILACRDVRGGTTSSIHSDGRAYDMGLPYRTSVARYSIIPNLKKNALRLGIQCLIWDREIWSNQHPDGDYYGGLVPHYDHIHVEQNWAGALHLNYTTAVAILRGSTPPPGDDSMSAADVAALKTFILQQLDIYVGKDLTVGGVYDGANLKQDTNWLKSGIASLWNGVPFTVTGDTVTGAQYAWLGNSIVHLDSSGAKAMLQKTGRVEERTDRLIAVTRSEWDAAVRHARAAGGVIGCPIKDNCLGHQESLKNPAKTEELQ